MAITITQPGELPPLKNLIVVIQGVPGVGKTSLGYTAKNPLIIDFDKKLNKAMYASSCPSITVDDWSQLEKIEAKDFDGFDTIIIDTAGKMVNCIIAYLAKHNRIKLNAGNPTQQSWGAVTGTASAFLDLLKSFNKHVVLIAHISENTANDKTTVRADIKGSTKNDVYKDADIMGYYRWKEGKRVLEFNSFDEAWVKDAGLGSLEVYLEKDRHFLGNLIDNALVYINSQNQTRNEKIKIVAQLKTEINNLTTAEEINAKGLDYKANGLFSKYPELVTAFSARATELGLARDNDKKCYVKPAPVVEQSTTELASDDVDFSI